jgi:TolB-like protein
MKRYVFIVLCVLSAAAAGFAKDNLAILPFTGGQGEEGETIAELFSFERELTAVFNPVPRTSINRAMRGERNFQTTSGMTDPDSIAALGKELGAQYVVSGSITTLGSQKLLVIGILRIDNLQQIAGDVQAYRTIEEIQDRLPGMARNIAAAARQDAAALPPVSISSGAEAREADTLARILAVYVIRGGKYAVYPRTASLEQIQEEYGNQFSGDTADENLPDLGWGTNPELVLAVTARKLGSRNMFNAAVINLVTGVQEAGESVSYQSLDEGIATMEELALVLTGSKWERTVSSAAAFARAIAAINAGTEGNYTVTLSGTLVMKAGSTLADRRAPACLSATAAASR